MTFRHLRKLDTKIASRILAIAGAFVVIASYAIGPFSQQAAKTYSCEKQAEGGTAKIAVAEWYSESQSPSLYGMPETEMAAVAINGLVFQTANSSLNSLLTCT